MEEEGAYGGRTIRGMHFSRGIGSENLAFSYTFEAWPGGAEKQEKSVSAARCQTTAPPLGGGLSYSCRASLRVYVMNVRASKVRGRPEFLW